VLGLKGCDRWHKAWLEVDH